MVASRQDGNRPSRRRRFVGRGVLVALLVAATLIAWSSPSAATERTEALTVRGQKQTLHLYGPATGAPVIVSSGDGGWIHLGPHVAEALAAKGYFVVGFDSRAYLESFTGRTTLSPADVQHDYAALLDYVRGRSTVAPTLLGVSEGAGLSVLAATDASVRERIDGVLTLGLPDVNELGWRWRDAVIYVTHGVPREPTFHVASLVDRVSPVPMAAIASTHDEFVPIAETQRVFDAAREPKRLWFVRASDHRFSDNLDEFDDRLVDALIWIRGTGSERTVPLGVEARLPPAAARPASAGVDRGAR